jgi:hypothetical protein
LCPNLVSFTPNPTRQLRLTGQGYLLLGFVWSDQAHYVDGSGLHFLEFPARFSLGRAFDFTFVGNKFFGKQLFPMARC